MRHKESEPFGSCFSLSLPISPLMKFHRSMSLIKKLLLCTLTALSAFFFQNCQPVQFSNIGSLALNIKSESNGGGYWGKPDYYRFTPGFTCEQKESAVSSLHIGETNVIFTENQKMGCAALTTTLDPKLIDHSTYQNEIVGYQEGIFEGMDSNPTSIPANLVEVWCRDGQDAAAIETITHYDRVSQQAVTRIYYSKSLQAKLIPDFSVARILSSNLVTVQNQDDFYLQVFRDRPAPQLGLFSGELKAVIEGQKIERQVSCRLGGSVDPKVWPAPEIVDSNPIEFKWAQDFSSFAYLSPNSSGRFQLFSSHSFGTNQLRLSLPDSQNQSISQFVFNPDMKSLSYWGGVLYGGEGLFQTPVTGSASTAIQLDQGFNGGASVLGTWNKILLTAKGDRILFEFSVPGQSGSYLRSISTVGGPSAELNPVSSSVASSVVTSAYDFQISKSTDRVAYLYGGYYPDLYIANVDGSNRMKVSLPATSSEWFFYGMNSNVRIPDPGNFVIVDAYTKDGPGARPHYEYFAVSIDGTQVIPLPVNYTWLASSASGFQVLLSDQYGQLALFDLQSLKSIPLPNSKDVFFSQDKPLLLSSRILADDSLEPMAISLKDLSEDSLCRDAKGSKIQISEIDRDRILISSFDAKAGQINVFVKDQDQPCQRKNSFPISAKTLDFKFMSMTNTSSLQSGLSPDGKKVLLHLVGSSTLNTFDNFYYVPLDGQPSILINTPVYSAATLTFAQFLSDSKSVVYSGTQIKPNWNSVFLWRLP